MLKMRSVLTHEALHSVVNIFILEVPYTGFLVLDVNTGNTLVEAGIDDISLIASAVKHFGWLPTDSNIQEFPELAELVAA